MEQKTNDKPRLRDYWQVLLRRKWIIILPIVIIFPVAILGSFLITPIYQASATLISQEVERGSFLEGITHIPIPRAEQMNSVRHKIESRRYMKDVADKVNIAEYLEQTGQPSNIDDVVRYLRKIIRLEPRSGMIIEIAVRHQDPVIAKDIADAIAETYIENTMTWRQETAIASMDFIKKQLERYGNQLNKSEEALREAQEKGVFDSLSSEDNALISGFAKLRTDLVEVELDLAEARSELENAKKFAERPGSYPSPLYTDPEIVSLQAKLVGLKSQYAELSIEYTEQYPELRKLKGEIIQIQKELDQAKTKLGSRHDISAQIEYWQDKVRSLEVKKAALGDKIDEQDRKLQQLPQRQLELARLQREKAASENTYSMLLKRLDESDLLRSSELQSMGRVAEILDLAIIPDHPVSPNRKMIAILALAMGIALGCGFTFVLEYFDHSFHSVEETVNHLGVPVLATIPRLTTLELEQKAALRKRLKLAVIILASLAALILIADIVSAEVFNRSSFFLSIAKRCLNSMRR